MSNPLLTKKLYAIAECPDLMVDACLWNGSFDLMFVSVWGRDTAIKSFLARLSLGRSQDGLSQFHVTHDSGHEFSVFIDKVDRLEKRFARVYRQTLFGSITNLWIFDRLCVQPDRANHRAVLLIPKDDANTRLRIWSTVKETCPLPLLDHWRDQVLELLEHHDMLKTLPFGLGDVAGFELQLNIELLKVLLGEKIRAGELTINSQDLLPAQLSLLEAA